MDPQANPATKRPTIQDRYNEVERQRHREEAIARQKAKKTVGEVAQDPIYNPPDGL